MCDQPCPECRKCDVPEHCGACNLETDQLIECVCGHWTCPDCTILCEGCDEAICPNCVVRRDGHNYCGELDCFPVEESDDIWGFTPKQAKQLTHRKDQPYKIVEDRDGIEWLVSMVVDNGRWMELIMMGTDGRVRKSFTSTSYGNYKITLGPDDLDEEPS